MIAVLMPHAPVLIPAIGGERAREVAASVVALREAAGRVVAAQPEVLVVLSPHSPRRSRAFGIWSGDTLHGSFEQFGASDVTVTFPVDHDLAAAIAAEAESRGIEMWEIPNGPLDHGAAVPLWFLAEAGWSGPTVVVSLNYSAGRELRGLGEAIAAAARSTGRRVALLASGDMSHRLLPGAPAGFHPRAREFDREFISRVRRGAYRDLLALDPELRELAAEDAVESTLIAAAATNWTATHHELLNYEGPFGVGYGVAVLCEPEPAQRRAGVWPAPAPPAPR